MEQRRTWRLYVNSDQWSSRILLGLLAIVFGIMAGMLVTAVNPLYAAAGIVGIFAALAILMNTQIGLYAFVGVVCLLPFGVIPVPLGGFKLTFLDAILAALLIVWLARLLTKNEEKVHFSRVGGYVIIFLFLAFVSFAAGADNGLTAQTVRLFLKIINSILLFFTALNCVRNQKQLDRVIAALLLAGGAGAVVGLILYVIPASTATSLLSSLRVLDYPTSNVLRYIADTETLRAISTSIDPNVLGAMLMVVSALGINQFLSNTPVIARKWLAPLLAVTLICLLLTYSRGSWLGLVAAVVFMAAIRYRRLWILFGLVIIIFMVGVVPADTSFVSHLESGISFQDEASAMRLGEYKDAINLITRYPWFGVGFGEAPSIDLYVGVSSIYLLMAEEMGLIGLALFLFLIGNVYFFCLKQLFSGDWRRTIVGHTESHMVGLLAALTSALVAGVFDHYFFNLQFPHTVALFWFIISLTMVSLRIIESRSEAGMDENESGQEQIRGGDRRGG